MKVYRFGDVILQYIHNHFRRCNPKKVLCIPLLLEHRTLVNQKQAVLTRTRHYWSNSDFLFSLIMKRPERS